MPKDFSWIDEQLNELILTQMKLITIVQLSMTVGGTVTFEMAKETNELIGFTADALSKLIEAKKQLND